MTSPEEEKGGKKIDKRRKSSGKEEGWDMDQRRRALEGRQGQYCVHGYKKKKKNETWM
jgi:hypothetical protein